MDRESLKLPAGVCATKSSTNYKQILRIEFEDKDQSLSKENILTAGVSTGRSAVKAQHFGCCILTSYCLV